LPAFSNKRETERAAEKIEWLLSCCGRPLDPELSKWLSQVPPKIYEQLIGWGLLDAKQIAVGKALSKHLNDFEQFLLAKGNTDHHVKTTVSRIRRVFDGCKFNVWADISASKVQQIISSLHKQIKVADTKIVHGKKVKAKKLKDLGEISAKSKNYYLGAVKQFCRWMTQDGRAGESPLEHLKNLNTQTDARHSRRALELDEIRGLLETAKAAPERFGMTGYERAMLYRLAVETGLRAKELRSLKVSSFDFNNCTVTVEAAYSKRRRKDTLPMKPETAAEIKRFLAGKLPVVQAFRVPVKTAEMLKADLEDAVIAYVDDAGRYADFHSLRHSTGSLLAASGVHPKVAQSIMRHSDINLTMSRYTHIFRGQESKAIASLPDLSLPSQEKQQAIATGTDDISSNDLPNTCQKGALKRISADSNGQLKCGNDIKNAVLNGPGRIRTYDQWIMSPLLYR